MLVPRSALTTSSAADSGTSTREKRSAISIAPISLPERYDSPVIAPKRSCGRTPPERPVPTNRRAVPAVARRPRRGSRPVACHWSRGLAFRPWRRSGAGAFFAQELPALQQWSFTQDDARRIPQPVLALLGTATQYSRNGTSCCSGGCPAPSHSTFPALVTYCTRSTPPPSPKDWLVSSPATRYPNPPDRRLTGRRGQVDVCGPSPCPPRNSRLRCLTARTTTSTGHSGPSMHRMFFMHGRNQQNDLRSWRAERRFPFISRSRRVTAAQLSASAVGLGLHASSAWRRSLPSAYASRVRPRYPARNRRGRAVQDR